MGIDDRDAREAGIRSHVAGQSNGCQQTGLVLVEGFKHEPVPKILLFRQNSGHRVEELVIDEHTIAVASDVSIATSLPLLDLNDVPQIATFIVSWLERQ